MFSFVLINGSTATASTCIQNIVQTMLYLGMLKCYEMSYEMEDTYSDLLVLFERHLNTWT